MVKDYWLVRAVSVAGEMNSGRGRGAALRDVLGSGAWASQPLSALPASAY